ncbi:MAG: hypothetical protein HYY84_01110 [Deltaproteobacteria bacterium]|nr:hypothetical protein [Deltaproteobacteria bacterium]
MTASVLFATLAAFTHAPSHPKKLVVAVTAHRIVVAFHVEVAVGERARMLRSLFDTNHDRQIDGAEEARLSTYLSERAKRALIVRLNGRRVPFATETRFIDGARTRVDAAMSIILKMALVSEPIQIRFGTNRLKISDAGFERAADIPVALALGVRGEIISGRQPALMSARGESTVFAFKSLEHPRDIAIDGK